MHNRTNHLFVFAAACVFAIAGCEKAPDTNNSNANQSPTAQPPKEPAPTETHHDDHSNETDAHHDHHHGESRDLGTVTISGTTMQVSIAGDLKPGTEMHVDIVHSDGPAPATLRLWIGDKSGEGSMKSKASGHDNHFHVHVEAPASLDGAALWFEVENADAERHSDSLPLE